MGGNLQLCYKLGIEMIQMAAGVMRLPFLLLGITRSVELAQKKLEVLPTGGRIPLGAGLDLAREVLKAQQLKDKDCIPVLVLLSDGRANAAAGGGHPVREAMEQAEKIRADGFQCCDRHRKRLYPFETGREELAEKCRRIISK